MMAAPRERKVLRKERWYPHPPEAVWVALTDPRAIAEWLMPNNFRAEVGAEFRFECDPAPMTKCGSVTRCRVLECDPPRRLVYSWMNTTPEGADIADEPMTVAWTLEARDGGTLLRFEQHGLETLGWLPRKMMTFGWGTMIKRWIPRVASNVDGAGVFTPGAIPREKRCYKTTTVSEEMIY